MKYHIAEPKTDPGGGGTAATRIQIYDIFSGGREIRAARPEIPEQGCLFEIIVTTSERYNFRIFV